MGSSWTAALSAWVSPAGRDSAPPAPRPRRAATTRPFREVATRSLARSATEPLPLFVPAGGFELAAWLSLPRDRQALLSAIASRLDAESQNVLRLVLSRGVLASRDASGENDLVAHLAALVTGPGAGDREQEALFDALLRAIAHPETLRAPTWIVVLARRRPAELARLVSGLAGPRSGVRTVSGRWLARHPDWLSYPGSLIGRLLGSACLQLEGFWRRMPVSP